MTRLAWTAAVLAVIAAAAPCADDGIHLPAGKTTSTTWTRNDKHGFRWDISGDGRINDGTSDAYDGGLMMRVDGSSFSISGMARLSADGTEIELGPWRRGNLSIWRRVHVNAEAGYCRWIDIFENTTTTEVTISLQYRSDMGEATRAIHTSGGKTVMDAKDWGVVTGDPSSSSSRPAVVHVFATPHAKVKPSFKYQQNTDNWQYSMTLTVPGGKKAAVCLFEAQRRPYSRAVKFLKGFDPSRELLRNVPPELRRIIVNMKGFSIVLGGIELRRSREADLLVLADGGEVLGKITNKQFALATEFGPVTLDADRLVGLVGVPGRQRVHAVLTDGQVIAGELTSGPVKVTLSGGSKLDVPPEGFTQVAWRIGPDRPEELRQTVALTVLRSGQRLAFADEADTFDFLTRHGPVKLRRLDLRSIELDTPDGGLHRAVFRNGSVLSGLLTADRLRGKLSLGLPADLPRQRVKRFLLPNPPVEAPGGARLTLRNGDTLHGRFTDKFWSIRSEFGKVTAATGEIVSASFNPAEPGRVELKLRNGTKITGKLEGDHVGFEVTPGPTLRIHPGQINSIAGAGDGKGGPPKDATAPTMRQPTRPMRVPTTMTTTTFFYR